MGVDFCVFLLNWLWRLLTSSLRITYSTSIKKELKKRGLVVSTVIDSTKRKRRFHTREPPLLILNNMKQMCIVYWLNPSLCVLQWLGLGIMGVGVWAWTEKDTFNNLSRLTNIALDPAFILILVGECFLFCSPFPRASSSLASRLSGARIWRVRMTRSVAGLNGGRRTVNLNYDATSRRQGGDLNSLRTRIHRHGDIGFSRMLSDRAENRKPRLAAKFARFVEGMFKSPFYFARSEKIFLHNFENM